MLLQIQIQIHHIKNHSSNNVFTTTSNYGFIYTINNSYTYLEQLPIQNPSHFTNSNPNLNSSSSSSGTSSSSGVSFPPNTPSPDSILLFSESLLPPISKNSYFNFYSPNLEFSLTCINPNFDQTCQYYLIPTYLSSPSTSPHSTTSSSVVLGGSAIEFVSWAPNSQQFVTVDSNFDIFLTNLNDLTPIQVTNSSDNYNTSLVSNGIYPILYQNFIFKNSQNKTFEEKIKNKSGIYWNSNSENFAYIKFNHSLVESIYSLHSNYFSSNFYAEISQTEFPKYNGKNPEWIEIVIYDVRTKNETKLNKELFKAATNGVNYNWEYVTAITWINENEILIRNLNRNQSVEGIFYL